MPLLDSTDARPIHFVGIAGAGMSALAELFLRRGVAITGCDANPDSAADLARLGVSVTPHDPSHVDNARALVVTSAMPKDHPELVRARERGVPVIRRAEALGEVTANRELVGVAGTHGKTTTTVMTATALAAAGRDPTALVGGRVAAWEGNLLAGGDRLYVVEADEYDRSFLALTPTVAVVTNIEADHLDIYADLADIKRTFAQFVRGARSIVLCADDDGANTLGRAEQHGNHPLRRRLSRRATRRARLSSGRERRRALTSPSTTNCSDGSTSPCQGDTISSTRSRPSARASRSARTFAALARGLATVAGAERRFQRLGDARGVTVVDDYGHHPTEIGATLAAARSAFPGRRIVAAFQPHLYSRTRDFASEFGTSLAGADAVFLTEIYPARERPIVGVSSSLVADAIRAAGGTLAWRGERTDLAAALAESLKAGDVVLTVGAGDITKTGPELLERLGRNP